MNGEERTKAKERGDEGRGVHACTEYSCIAMAWARWYHTIALAHLQESKATVLS